MWKPCPWVNNLEHSKGTYLGKQRSQDIGTDPSWAQSVSCTAQTLHGNCIFNEPLRQILFSFFLGGEIKPHKSYLAQATQILNKRTRIQTQVCRHQSTMLLTTPRS